MGGDGVDWMRGQTSLSRPETERGDGVGEGVGGGIACSLRGVSRGGSGRGGVNDALDCSHINLGTLCEVSETMKKQKVLKKLVATRHNKT